MERTIRVGNILTEEMMQLIDDEELTDAQLGALIRGTMRPDKFKQRNAIVRKMCINLSKGYVAVSVESAKSQMNDVIRLNRYYEKHPDKAPRSWCDTFQNVSETFQNVLDTFLKRFPSCGLTVDNVLETLKEDKKRSPLRNTKYEIRNTITDNNLPKELNDIPPKSPSGDSGGDSEDSSDSSTADFRSLADAIETTEAFTHARVNAKDLRRCCRAILKKDAADVVLSGLAAWEDAWRAEDWRYVPGRITDWLYDGKYLQEPRKKEAPQTYNGSNDFDGEIA